MNCSTYLFGNNEGNFFQYPREDSIEKQLRCVSEHLGSEPQISVFRADRLMYYAYMVRTNSRVSSSYFGICAIVNNVMTYNLPSMFRMFEAIFREVVLNNRILTINDQGAPAVKSTDVDLLQQEHNSVSAHIMELLSEGERFFETIKVMDCSVQNDDYYDVHLSAGKQNLKTAIDNHKLVNVVKGSDPMNPYLNGLALKIRGLNDELRTLKANNKKLQNKIKRMSCYTIGSIILLLVVIAAVLIF